MDQMTLLSASSHSSVDMREVADAVRDIRSAWKTKDYPTVAHQSRRLLEREPDNIYGLIYLARAAAYTEDWPEVIRTGQALVGRSPRVAFDAARKLNRAARSLEAAGIFAELQVTEDWFDTDVAELARKEGNILLRAGQSAYRDGQLDQAKLLWVAGARIAPATPGLSARLADVAREAEREAGRRSLNDDPAAYIHAWREVLWITPSHVQAAIRIARASERVGEKVAIDAWLNVLAIEPENEAANRRLPQLAKRYDLEDYAVRGLVQQGADESASPLVVALAESRDARTRETHDKLLKARLRQAVARAQSLAESRDLTPRMFLEAWKEVLVLNPQHLIAARKVVSAARQLGDQSELVEGLVAMLEILPGDLELRDRLASAGRRAGREQRVLDYLARRGLADLSVERINTLRVRVLRECRDAAKALEFDHALRCFETLELVDDQDPALQPIRAVLAAKAATSAKNAEKEGNLAIAVPLAQQILAIVPDQPVALLIVARDLWRHRRLSELVQLCESQVKPGPQYDPVRKLLDRAAAIS